MNSPLAENTPPTTTSRSRRDHWCHQASQQQHLLFFSVWNTHSGLCSAEIIPMMMPHPLCPECHSEFVEKIEEGNDLQSFVEIGHEQGEDGDDEQEGQETMGLEDLLRVIQLLSSAPLSSNQRGQQGQAQLQLPGGYPTGTGAGTPTSPFSLFNAQTTRSASGNTTTSAAAARAASTELLEEDEEMLEIEQDTAPRQQLQDPPTSISSLLERIGLELNFMNEGGQPGLGGFGGLFNMVGNPGDYVFGQGGLDDVITQMMELQSRQNGPVALSEEAINELPQHTLTSEELDAKTECSVCKDEFERQDICTQLQCKHIFHEDCIKPWLKTSATCPTCRFSLVPVEAEEGGEDDEDAQQQQHQNQQQRHFSRYSSDLPGSFPHLD
ncbi:hypothetical protein BGZ96_009771 [Linnemannia gamsii]|uniref:RING-type domain-containing protein n=1 Tax=Linnemannia gamsii TaxID=64522 RepID=A0ABQ7JXL6_9FUNG|nr:hypothetical protein BGZ96_009771 [Linnemannia gamsii]